MSTEVEHALKKLALAKVKQAFKENGLSTYSRRGLQTVLANMLVDAAQNGIQK